MFRFGTPNSSSALRVMMLGCGELGKEVAISLQRLGCEVIAVDRYAGAPAMQVAHRSHVIDMTNGAALKEPVTALQPISTGKQPAIPPHTMFCSVRRFSSNV